MIRSAKSWVWEHCTKLDKDTGRCNFCMAVVIRRGGTAALESHLKAHHKMPNPRDLAVKISRVKSKPQIMPRSSVNSSISTRGFSQDNSTENCRNASVEIKEEPIDLDSLIDFQEISDDHSIFGHSSNLLEETTRPVRAARFTSNNVNDSLGMDSAWSGQNSLRIVESSSINSFSKDNCYVCNNNLTCRNKLSLKMKFSDNCLFEVLESFTGFSISESARNGALVCHSCLVSFEKFDDLQRQANEIQNHLTQTYCQTHDDMFFTNDEPEKGNEDSNDGSWYQQPERSRASASNSLNASQYFCGKCNRHFNKCKYDIHMASNHEVGTGPFNCGICVTTCNDLDSLKHHYVQHSLQEAIRNKRDVASVTSVNGYTKRYACRIPDCSKIFITSSKLKSHLKVHYDIKNYQCTICGKRFTENFELTAHKKHKHAAETVEPIKITRCFDGRANVVESSKFVDNSGRFKALESIARSKEILMKKRLPNEMRRFVCFIPGCSKNFTSGFKLRSHIRVHNGEKPFGCQRCNKKFTDKFELNAHNKKKHPVEELEDPLVLEAM